MQHPGVLDALRHYTKRFRDCYQLIFSFQRGTSQVNCTRESYRVKDLTSAYENGPVNDPYRHTVSYVPAVESFAPVSDADSPPVILWPVRQNAHITLLSSILQHLVRENISLTDDTAGSSATHAAAPVLPPITSKIIDWPSPTRTRERSLIQGGALHSV